jgi:hypothetical protein
MQMGDTQDRQIRHRQAKSIYGVLVFRNENNLSSMVRIHRVQEIVIRTRPTQVLGHSDHHRELSSHQLRGEILALQVRALAP